MTNMDSTIFNVINGLLGKYVWLDVVGIFFASFAIFFLVGILIYVWFRVKTKKKHRMVAVAALSALIANGLIVQIVKGLWYRPRPFLDTDIVHFITNYNSSFPSSHATFMFALSMSVYFFNKKLGIIFFVVSILTGVARIFAGVHWPSDILAGAVLGILVAAIVKHFFKKVLKEV